tara:strand:+ start:19964 stop:21730 length:1767 start_codon:yes stop_codon:yes gene_type:complete
MAETLISPGVLARENDISFIAPAAIEAGAAIIGPTVKGPVEEPVKVTSYGQYQNIFGTVFTSGSTKQEFLTSIAVKSYFNQGGNSMLVTRVVTGSFGVASNSTISAADSGTAPFTLATLGKGAIFNNITGSTYNEVGYDENSDGSLVSGSSDNLRWEIVNQDTAAGTFGLLIRRGDDNSKNKIILETWNDLSLDPNSENYIESVIGNQSKSKAVDNGQYYITTTGEYVNRSKYIRVSGVARQTLDYVGNDGLTVGTDESGNSFSGSLPSNQSGSFHGGTGNNVVGGSTRDKYFGDINGTDTQGLTGACYADAISILGNQDEYVFNIISAPGLIYEFGDHKTQLDSIISTAESRGDCIAVIDVQNYGATVANVTGTAATLNSSYTATYWPWLQTLSSNGKTVWIPASVIIPGVYAFTDSAAAPWFAPAGLTRGGLGDVIQAERKLTRSQRDTLYNANVNPIATFPGSGISVFGQKTLQKKKSALDRVNVRRLLIDLKKFLGDTAKQLVFEQNTIATRNSFLATVNPYLESVVQRQGLYAYRVVMDDSNNTPDTIDRNQLIGQVFIQPAKTVEFVVLDFTIEPTGATFGA